MPTFQTIDVKTISPAYMKGDAICSEAVKPGHFIEIVAAGTLRKNTRVAAGTVPRTIALHHYLDGRTITDAYASGDRVSYQTFYPGDCVQVILKSGSNATKEELLRFDNTGCVLDSGTNAPACHALEALDLSGEGAVDTLIYVRLL